MTDKSRRALVSGMEDTSLTDFLDAGEEAEPADDEVDDDADGEANDDADAGPGSPRETAHWGDGPSEAGETSATDDAGDGRVPPTDVTPAASTGCWHATPAACDDCGTEVRRRWRTDAGTVCADCVDW